MFRQKDQKEIWASTNRFSMIQKTGLDLNDLSEEDIN